MATAEATEIFSCTPTQFFSLISDYTNYHQFLSEVRRCEVVKTEGKKKLVKFHVFMIKNFSYRLWITEEKDQGIQWKFESGDLFKESEGYWRLQEVNGKTKATYGVQAQFKLFVPGPIAKALVNVNLPNMMNAYKRRVSELYGQ